MTDLYCSECLKPCEGRWFDFGIGDYEFWGTPGIHRDVQFVSECCEKEVHLNGARYEPDPSD